jgi:hypothetical protein
MTEHITEDTGINRIKKSEETLKDKPKKLDIGVSVEAMPGDKDRIAVISFKFNPSMIEKEDIKELATQVLKDSKGKLVKQLEQTILQEQKWLDRTRN